MAFIQRDETALNIYTDGSSFSAPRVGGVGLRFVAVDEQGEEHVKDVALPAWKGATNNQMELQAVIEALKLVVRDRPFPRSQFTKVVFYTDSMYVSDNFNSAKYEWPRSHWTNRDSRPIANADQWKELIKLARRVGMRVDVKWVKGHRRDPHNKQADRLAKESARSPSRRILRPHRVRRKKSAHQVELGSVRMEGQTTVIRIITDERLPVQRVYRYKYEVMDESSPSNEHVDVAFSDEMLGAGHTYRVRFNSEPRNPRIVEVLDEIIT